MAVKPPHLNQPSSILSQGRGGEEAPWTPQRARGLLSSSCRSDLSQCQQAHAQPFVYQQSGNAMRAEEEHSLPHTDAATQEQTKPPPTLLTSPPHITLLKNTHKQTKKKKERTGNGKHCAGMPPCNRQRDSHAQKELPRQHQTARLDTEKEKKRETSSSFSIKAPRPLSLPLVGYPPSTSSMQHKFSRVAETAVSAPTRLIDPRQ